MPRKAKVLRGNLHNVCEKLTNIIVPSGSKDKFTNLLKGMELFKLIVEDELAE